MSALPIPSNASYRTVPQESKVFRVADLVRHPKNPKEHDLGSLHESFSDIGFYGGVIVWKPFGATLAGYTAPKGKQWILAGAGRHEAYEQAGQETIPGWEVDVSALVAGKILLSDNEQQRRAGYNDAALLDFISHLIEDAGSVDLALAGTGFDGDDVDDIKARLDAPTLADMRERHGEPSGKEAWPRISLVVPKEVMLRFSSLMARIPGIEDHTKFDHLLTYADDTLSREGL